MAPSDEDEEDGEARQSANKGYKSKKEGIFFEKRMMPMRPNQVKKRHLDADLCHTTAAIDGSKKSKPDETTAPTKPTTPTLAKQTQTTHGIKLTQAIPVFQQPITKEDEMPQKKYYQSRAHCNPLLHNDIFNYPKHPGLMDSSVYYPPTGMGTCTATSTAGNAAHNQPTMLDVGCGFGGLTIKTSYCVLLVLHIGRLARIN